MAAIPSDAFDILQKKEISAFNIVYLKFSSFSRFFICFFCFVGFFLVGRRVHLNALN